MRVIIIVLLLTGCAQDLDINPLTTVMKHVLIGEHNENGALPHHHSKPR